MNPCFGPAQIRDLMPIFYEKALQVSPFIRTSGPNLHSPGLKYKAP